MTLTKRYKHKEDIDKVVELLIDLGLEIFFSIEDNKMIIVDEGNFRFKGIELYNIDQSQQTELGNELNLIIEILSKIESIDRVLYLYLYPNCQFPTHIDSDDNYYRIVTGAIINNNVEFRVLDNVASISTKKSIGFQASRIEHSLTNKSDDASTILVLCLNQNSYDIDELVEIQSHETL